MTLAAGFILLLKIYVQCTSLTRHTTIQKTCKDEKLKLLTVYICSVFHRNEVFVVNFLYSEFDVKECSLRLTWLCPSVCHKTFQGYI